MHPKFHEMRRLLRKGLALLLVIVVATLAASVTLIGWNEFKRTRQLDRLSRETQVPQALIDLGERPLVSLFGPVEERVCVLHPYTGNRGIEAMSPEEEQAVRRLDLPSEDLTWYLVAFQGKAVARVLLINETTVAELASDSMCFGRHDIGLIQVQQHPTWPPPIRQVQFIKWSVK
jgi:hypothetical protein